ncbi:hypothetical protein [Pseudomonas sp. PH1b]|uniref:hypothetical protein n=1 Tax=Pseudomonas sp. PH1b TaxID=1397282 RepID=UPI0015A733E7|nr:hypothetical protein [Pseudomonas sp. PH1b]
MHGILLFVQYEMTLTMPRLPIATMERPLSGFIAIPLTEKKSLPLYGAQKHQKTIPACNPWCLLRIEAATLHQRFKLRIHHLKLFNRPFISYSQDLTCHRPPEPHEPRHPDLIPTGLLRSEHGARP